MPKRSAPRRLEPTVKTIPPRRSDAPGEPRGQIEPPSPPLCRPNTCRPPGALLPARQPPQGNRTASPLPQGAGSSLQNPPPARPLVHRTRHRTRPRPPPDDLLLDPGRSVRSKRTQPPASPGRRRVTLGAIRYAPHRPPPQLRRAARRQRRRGQRQDPPLHHQHGHPLLSPEADRATTLESNAGGAETCWLTRTKGAPALLASTFKARNAVTDAERTNVRV